MTTTSSGRPPQAGPLQATSATFVGMPKFPYAAPDALTNTQQRRNLAHATGVIRAKRARVVGEIERWEELRQAGADASAFQGAFVGGAGTDLYRLQARVALEAGKILLLTRDVALGTNYSRTAPWRILRTQRQLVTPAA